MEMFNVNNKLNLNNTINKTEFSSYNSVIKGELNEFANNNLIRDNKFESNNFVSRLEEEDCVRYSNTSKCFRPITYSAHKCDDECRCFNKRFKEMKYMLLSWLYEDSIKVTIIHELSKFEFNLSKFTTVGRLKQICSNKTNIKLNKMYLRFNGKYLLNDEVTLEQCGLSDGCRIELFGGKMLSLLIQSNRKCYTVSVNEYSTVGQLKQIISDKIIACEEKTNTFNKKMKAFNKKMNDIKEEIDREMWDYHVSLVFNGSVMRNDMRLIDYEICDFDTLLMMSHALGGGCIHAQMIPLTDGCKSFQITNMFDLDDLIGEILTINIRYDSKIDRSLIKLYSDADKINQIRNNQDLSDLYNKYSHSNQMKIYYEIISEFNEFVKIKKLGEGSFGKVYKYKNMNINQIFALKKFDCSTNQFMKEIFQREVDCYLILKSHPRIIKYEKHFIANNKSYILMEYMDRGSLGSYVRVKDPFSEHIIARYALQILEGLEYLHYNRILHRNLKGDNILLNENDDLKLCDFGLAKILKDLSSEDFLNGVVQSTVGTLNWMSPETINGELCGPFSDIWSFGATMVEIITRKCPHQGLTIAEMYSNILAGKIIFDYPANSSDDMKSFINSCLKRDPKERASIQDLYQHSFLKKNRN